MFYESNICDPLKFVCGSPDPHCDGIRGLWAGIRTRGWNLMNGIHALIRTEEMRELAPTPPAPVMPLSREDTLRRRLSANQEVGFH